MMKNLPEVGDQSLNLIKTKTELPGLANIIQAHDVYKHLEALGVEKHLEKPPAKPPA